MINMIVTFVIICIIIIILYITTFEQPEMIHMDYVIEEPIDIVYTWVDGNNPEWLVEKNIYNPDVNTTDNHTNRFRDNDELKYSLRSLDQFAPWIRNIFIVTFHEDSYPSFLNVDHPKIKIIPHSMIFRDQSHLPTYNSHAIESNIGRIPGLSKRFLYSNDDMMFGSTITKNDFIDMNGNMMIGKNGINVKAIESLINYSPHQRSWVNLSGLINTDYGFRLHTIKPSHHIQIVDKEILNSIYPVEMNKTSASRFRSNSDIPPIGASLLTAFFTGKSRFIKRPELYTSNKKLNSYNNKDKQLIKFICVNDQTHVDKTNYDTFYSTYTPIKSTIELFKNLYQPT